MKILDMINFTFYYTYFLKISLLLMYLSFADGLEIRIDSSEAPELYDFCQVVKREILNFYEYLTFVLRSPSYTPPQEIGIFFNRSYTGRTYSIGNLIVANPSYFYNHPEDIGQFVHELVHIVQDYPDTSGGKCPYWVREGIADWVRYFAYEDNGNGGLEKPNEFDYYSDGGKTSAYFLEYLSDSIDQWTQHRYGDIVLIINKACRDNTYEDTIWEKITGRTLEQLWTDLLSGREYIFLAYDYNSSSVTV